MNWRPAAKSLLRDVYRHLPPPGKRVVAEAYHVARSKLRKEELQNGDPLSMFRVRPAPPPILEDWPEPPFVAKSGAATQNLYETGARPPRYDLELLEALNEEYRDKPIVPKAPSYAPKSLAEAAKGRLTTAHNTIDLSKGRVLEIGCGNGYEVWFTAHGLGADAYGVDVVERLPWAQLRDDKVHLHCVDLTKDSPFESDFFDRIVSFVVWEHVVHPYRLLEETYRMMKPGGLAYIRANLHRGPLASHLYRDLHFPWPHLLFSDDVIESYYVKQGHAPRRSAWVNQLTWAHYEKYFADIGFILRMRRFDIRPIDEAFYTRFEDVLGRFPRFDLERDFFTVVLEKPAR